jgi:hypothetical protein
MQLLDLVIANAVWSWKLDHHEGGFGQNLGLNESFRSQVA